MIINSNKKNIQNQTKNNISFIKSINKFSFNPILTPLAIYIHIYISSKPRGWRLNIKDISNHFKESEASIYRAIKLLSIFGYINRKKRYNHGFYQFYTYTVKPINDKGSFTMLPTAILNDNNISVNAKHIYNYLLSKPKNWIFYIYDISKRLNISKNTIYKAIQELINHNYLERNRVRNNGQFAGFHYKPLIVAYKTNTEDVAIFNKGLFGNMWGQVVALKHLSKSPYPKFENSSYIKFLKENNMNTSQKINYTFNTIWSQYPKEKQGTRVIAYRTFKKHIKPEDIPYILKAFDNYKYHIKAKSIEHVKYLSNWIKDKDDHNWRCYIEGTGRGKKITDIQLNSREKEKFKDIKKSIFLRNWHKFQDKGYFKNEVWGDKGDIFQLFLHKVKDNLDLLRFEEYVKEFVFDKDACGIKFLNAYFAPGAT